LANLYLSYGLFAEARGNLKPLVKGHPKDIDVLNMMATSFLMEGKYDHAVKYYVQIPSGSKERVDIGVNYAFALYLSGEKEKALNLIDDVESSKNSHWNDYFKQVKKIIGNKS